MTDKEIDELIAEELIKNEQDKNLYQRIYKDLSQEDTDLQLSDRFNLSVLDQLKYRKRQIIKENFWIFFGVASLAFCTLVIIAITDAFGLFSSNRQILVYAIIFCVLYVVFQRIERLILKS